MVGSGFRVRFSTTGSAHVSLQGQRRNVLICSSSRSRVISVAMETSQNRSQRAMMMRLSQYIDGGRGGVRRESLVQASFRIGLSTEPPCRRCYILGHNTRPLLEQHANNLVRLYCFFHNMSLQYPSRSTHLQTLHRSRHETHSLPGHNCRARSIPTMTHRKTVIKRQELPEQWTCSLNIHGSAKA